MERTQAIKAVQLLASAIVDSVKTAGSLGAPGGVIYAALMAHGCSLAQYEQIMGALVRVGRLTRRGELYFVTKA